MGFFIYFLIGFVAGIFYGEHIYRQARIFPKRHPFFNFFTRFSAMALFLYLIIKNAEGLYIASLTVGLSVGIITHTLVRGFLLIKY